MLGASRQTTLQGICRIALLIGASIALVIFLISLISANQMFYGSSGGNDSLITRMLSVKSKITRTLSVKSKYVDLVDVSIQLDGHFDCVRLKMRPSPAVCLYPDNTDQYISKQIRHEGQWEPRILRKAFQDILYRDPQLGVLDIGANIGVYSLVSAAMGHNVISVEPYVGNYQRLHKAVNLGHFEDRIIIVRNALSNKREIVFLDRSLTNQGVIKTKHTTICKDPSTCVRSAYIDDLLTLAKHHFRSGKFIIKVDIEGHERFAFRRCDALLDAFYVPFIFMEWQIMVLTRNRQSEDWSLIDDLVKHLIRRGYTPFDARTQVPQHIGAWNNWAPEIVWKHKLAAFN